MKHVVNIGSVEVGGITVRWVWWCDVCDEHGLTRLKSNAVMDADQHCKDAS